MEIKDLEKKVSEKRRRLEEIEQELLKPEVQKKPELLALLSREYKEVKELLDDFERLKAVEEELKEISRITGEEWQEVIEKEKVSLTEEKERLYQKVLSYFLPNASSFRKNCLVEIRAAAGGEEAALFAADLFRMYTKYIEKQKLTYSVLSSTPSDRGGFKEIIFAVEGEDAYDKLRFEQGVHRVQRVPITEASGRIHTSTVTVAVLPEPEEVEVNIRPEDLKIDVFRASGHGGQHLQMTDSAVRITHLPTGITVTCQDERSQHQNKEKALKILKARLLEREKRKKEEAILSERRKQIGQGERAEKIRTYNFPQNRVTDHRINLSLYNLGEILNGELAPIIKELKKKEIEELLCSES
ncbi:MAG: peptide chain release factor 1 [candidate division WOR-3 bacterium]